MQAFLQLFYYLIFFCFTLAICPALWYAFVKIIILAILLFNFFIVLLQAISMPKLTY